MDKLESLKKKVAALYEAKTPGRADWADWIYDQHIPFVASNARELAEKRGADPNLAEAAAWLHDIADSKMRRQNEKHEEESLRMARQLMEECGYSKEEVDLVVEDAIRLHSCHDGVKPKSLEGRVLATVDALAHLKTDFYVFTARMLAQEKTLEETKQWTLGKLERDFAYKICFDDIRETVRHDYEVLKNLFSRPPVK